MIFCGDCSARNIPVKGYEGPQRVCNQCFGMIRANLIAERKQMENKKQNFSNPNHNSDPPIDVIEL